MADSWFKIASAIAENCIAARHVSPAGRAKAHLRCSGFLCAFWVRHNMVRKLLRVRRGANTVVSG